MSSAHRRPVSRLQHVVCLKINQCVHFTDVYKCTAADNSECVKRAFWHVPTASGDGCRTQAVWWVIVIGGLVRLAVLAAIAIMAIILLFHGVQGGRQGKSASSPCNAATSPSSRWATCWSPGERHVDFKENVGFYHSTREIFHWKRGLAAGEAPAVAQPQERREGRDPCGTGGRDAGKGDGANSTTWRVRSAQRE